MSVFFIFSCRFLHAIDGGFFNYFFEFYMPPVLNADDRLDIYAISMFMEKLLMKRSVFQLFLLVLTKGSVSF